MGTTRLVHGIWFGPNSLIGHRGSSTLALEKLRPAWMGGYAMIDDDSKPLTQTTPLGDSKILGTIIIPMEPRSCDNRRLQRSRYRQPICLRGDFASLHCNPHFGNTDTVRRPAESGRYSALQRYCESTVVREGLFRDRHQRLRVLTEWIGVGVSSAPAFRIAEGHNYDHTLRGCHFQVHDAGALMILSRPKVQARIGSAQDRYTS